MNTSQFVGQVKQKTIPPEPPPTSPLKLYNMYTELNHIESSVPPITLPATLNSQPAKILLDSGSSGNFIARKFVNKYKLKTEPTKETYSVKLADGRKHPTNELVADAKLGMNEYKSKEDLIVLPLDNYDSILGMPWLEKVNPHIDWKSKTIEVAVDTLKENQKKITIKSDQEKTVQKQNNEISYNINDAHYNHDDKITNEQSSTEQPTVKNEIQQERKLLLSALKFKREVLRNKSEVYLGMLRLTEDPKQQNTHQLMVTEQTSEYIESTETKELIEEYIDLFPKDLPTGLPPRRWIEHRIDLEIGAKPVSKGVYRMSTLELDELKKQLDKLLESGFIRPSESPWGSPILFTPKKDGGFRLCIDYRALNAMTTKNTYPLPHLDDLFNQTQGSTYFSKIDLHSGYHQIRMRDSDIEKTAFRTRYGLFEFLVLPFGLTNAPATFMHLMNNTFKPLLDKSVIVFLDDILIYSKTKSDHVKHVKEVLDILRREKLYCKRSKCQFFQKKIEFLGHTLSEQGKGMQEDKVSAIMNWPTPTTADEVASFVGLCGWYQEFIDGFSRICAPLNRLKQKEVKFEWTAVEQNALEELKSAITNAPVLILPDPKLPYVVMTDASGIAIGASLNQDHGNGLQPIAFLSKKLLPAETRYPVHEQELLAVIQALKKWRHHLHGSATPITVQTDNKSIIYLLTQPNLSNRQRRWMETISEYKLKFEYKKGSTNVVADALSRRCDHNEKSTEQELTVNTIMSYLTMNSLISDLKEAYQLDAECVKILQGSCPPDYEIKNGIIYRKSKIVIPDDKTKNMKTRIIHEAHDVPTSGHLGIMKTMEKLERKFYWKNMYEEVKNYITSCYSCQRNKPVNQAPMGLLQPIPVPEGNWKIVSMDLITQLPKSRNGNDAIVVIIDKMSKMAHFIATTTNIDAPKLAQLYFDNIVRYHGIPMSIISDRDVRFTSNFWKSLWQLTGTKLKLSTAYHPESDGQTERMNRTLEDIIRSYVNYQQNNWDEKLIAAEIAYNNSKQVSTGFTPYYMNYGYEINLPISLLTPTESSNPTANEMIGNINTAMEQAKKNIKLAQERQSLYANKSRRDITFKKDELVLLSTANIRNEQRAPKLSAKYIGPFRISRVISDVAYELILPPTMKIHNVFHISKLRKFVKGEQFPNRTAIDNPPAEIIDGEDYWEVEQIVKKRERRYGNGQRIEYLVKWTGYDHYENTWEPKDNLMKSASDAIKLFEEQQ